MRTSRDFDNRKKLYRLSQFVVLALMVFAPSLIWARVTTITTLPYTASQVGTAYSETLVVAGTRINGTGNGINFTGNNIVLYLVGDTIRFGASGSDGLYGLNFATSAHHIKVEGGWVIHGIDNDTQSNGVTCVSFDGAPHDLLFHNTNMIVSGDNAHCMDSYGSGVGLYNVEVNGGRFWSYCRRYTSRCNYDGAVLRFEAAGSGGSYNIRIRNINIMTGPGQGLVASGRLSSPCRAEVYACTISTDHRNDFYPNDDGNVCHNSANPYAIHLRFVGVGTTIHDNVLRSGASYGGCRGLMIENVNGNSSNYVEVYNNDSNTHEGPNVHYGEDFQNFGLRIRPIDGGTVSYVWVHDNKFIVTGDTDPNTTDYGSHPIGGCYSNDGANKHVIVERNLFRAYAHTGSGVNSKGFMFDGVTGDTSFVFRYNRIEADRAIFKFGDYNFGARGIMLNNDTLNFVSPRAQDAETYHVGHLGNDWDCGDLAVKDMVYENSASDTNIVFAANGALELSLLKTLTIQVVGANNLPVRGATVTAVNHYGRTIISGTTDDQGMIDRTATYWYETRVGSDSTAFNTFTLKARKLTDSTTVTYNVTASSPPVQIRLANTNGDGQENDNIPPGRINDLGALPGDPQGRVRLSWTAPGDDDFSGLADYYIIKFSRSPISEANWNDAEAVIQPPTPLDGGTPQVFEIEGLSPGEVFYSAIKAVDDFGNSSQLSNVPDAFASGIVAPGPIDIQVQPENGLATLTVAGVASYQAIFYQFVLDSSSNFSAPRIEVDILADSSASAAFDSLSGDFNYFCRCRAVASSGLDSSAWSPVGSFGLLTGVTQLVADSDCLYPNPGAVVQSNRPAFTVAYIPNVDNIYIQVAADRSFASAYESGSIPVTAGSQTNWEIPWRLENNTAYFWRASSDNLTWTSPINFTAIADIHPYPNPFRLSEGHSGITFTNLPENCRINIATVSGNTVREVKGVGPDTWVWDVKNDDGRDLASGIYLYTVQSKSAATMGKVMIIR